MILHNESHTIDTGFIVHKYRLYTLHNTYFTDQDEASDTDVIIGPTELVKWSE